MTEEDQVRTEEVRPGNSDQYWSKLVRGIRIYGSRSERKALDEVMHGLRHADLHPSEKLGDHIGGGKARTLPRRCRKIGS